MNAEIHQTAPRDRPLLMPSDEAGSDRNGRSAYTGYDEWKNWAEEDFFRVSSFERGYLSADFEGIELKGKKLLEIGFGNGALLSWAHAQGAVVHGIEILDSSIKRAKSLNIPLLSSDVRQNIPEYTEFFDVVVAYDVLEHLTVDEVAKTLQAVSALLKPGGRLMLRFPNGQSPFGRSLQHADHTHRSILSAAIIGQLIVGTSLRITRSVGETWRPDGGLARRIGLLVKRRVRSTTEWFLKKVFDLEGELGKNVVLVLTKLPLNGHCHPPVAAAPSFG